MPTVREQDLTLRTSVSADDHSVSWKVKCLNCGSALVGPFCAECGQRAVPPNPTLKELAGDAFSEFSGWDGKLANTVRALLARPGELTQQWLEGRRVHFISPVRLYLTASFLYFLVAAAAPNLRPSSDKIEIAGLEIGATTTSAGKVSQATGEAVATRQPLTGAQRDSALLQIQHAPKPLRALFRKIVTDPQGFRTTLFETVSKVFFVLVPVFALILGLFYRHKHFPEHLSFAIHFFSFFFVARALGNLVLFSHMRVLAAIAQAAMALWIIYYAVAAARRVYGGSIPMTILKGIGICVLYGLVALPLMVVAVFYAAR